MHVSGNNMNMEIIIMGHGHFASGLYSTLELIGGEQEHVAWIDFTEDKDMMDCWKNSKRQLTR